MQRVCFKAPSASVRLVTCGRGTLLTNISYPSNFTFFAWESCNAVGRVDWFRHFALTPPPIKCCFPCRTSDKILPVAEVMEAAMSPRVAPPFSRPPGV